MRTLSTKRLDYLAAGSYTDCRCVRIVRADGVTLRITDHHTDVDMGGGIVYQAGTGYESSATQSTATLSVDNLEVRGTYGAAGISRTDLEGGLYKDCSIFVFDTDYKDPVEDEDPKKAGFYGEVTTRDLDFTIEFRSLTQVMQQPVGRLFTRSDHYNLEEGGIDLNPPTWQATTAYSVRDANDARVGDTIQPTVWNGYHYICTTAGTSGATEPTWTTTGLPDVNDGTVVWQSILAPLQKCTVSAVTDNQNFSYTGSFAPDGYLKGGEVRWTSGNNNLLVMEAVSDSTGDIELFLPMPSTIQIGDTFDAVLGYDRNYETLRDRFANIRNYGGFPFMPGPNASARVGGQG